MEWFRVHAYTVALGGAALLVLGGAYVVAQRSVPPQTTGAIAWGGSGALLDPEDRAAPAQQVPQSILSQLQSGSDYALPLPQLSALSDFVNVPESFDYGSFIAMLTGGNTSSASEGTTIIGSSAYSFIPGGLISVDAPAARSAQEQAVYEYGNNVGSLIQSFEQQHPSMTQILHDQAQDRSSTAKAAAVTWLAGDLAGLGDTLLQMDDVPIGFAAAHAAVGNSYKTLGEKLSLVPKAQRDTDFLQAVQNYNAAAESFVQKYVALADLFVAYGVSFSPADAGSVFTFTNAGL